MERRVGSGERDELFRGGGAELYLIVEREESVMLQKGEFVLLLVKHACSPLAAVVAMVGDMQWPVGKDSLVFKGKENRYSFSLPASGLTFSLSFVNPLLPAPLALQRLDCLLHEYSTFLHQAGTEMVHEAAEFWTKIARNAEPEESILHAMLHTSAPFHMECISPKLAQKMQQARRMSAVQKLFARSIETGAINPSTHVKMAEADASRGGQADAELVVASVDAVVKVVEAVETAGKTLFENAQTTSTDWIQRRYGKEEGKKAEEGLDAVGSLITSAWTLNKMGLRMLFRTIASIHSKSNTSSSDSRSSWSMDVSGRLHLSSSGSFSSISSKLPSELPAENASLSRFSCTPSSLTVDSPPRAQAVVCSSSIVDTTRAQQGNGTAAATQGVFRSPPLPPRFYEGALPPRLTRVIPARSLAAAAPAGTEPSGFRLYKPQPSAAQAAMSNAPSHVQCPPRPPPRPRSI